MGKYIVRFTVEACGRAAKTDEVSKTVLMTTAVTILLSLAKPIDART
jgi:hypothetical protein